MDILETILEIAKYVIPALVVLIAANQIVGKFVSGETRRKHLEIMKTTSDTTLRLRLQAYERLALFLERIHPRSVITRIYQPEMTVRDLQVALTQTIRTEFDHNLSQQIYVSAQMWNMLYGVKEQIMAAYNQIAASLHPESSAKELHKKLIEHFMSEESNPIEIALEMLNKEAKIVLRHQD